MTTKKQIRAAFRKAVFARDRYRCAVCKRLGHDRQGGDDHLKFHSGGDVDLDAHHITSRDTMPNGGYVAENGISLCDACHVQAEDGALGFLPDDLYELIGSDYKAAVRASQKLE